MGQRGRQKDIKKREIRNERKMKSKKNNHENGVKRKTEKQE